MAYRQFSRHWRLIVGCIFGLLAVNAAAGPEDLVDSIDARWGVERLRQTESAVRGFPLPLGPIEKVRGTWQHKASQPIAGQLLRTTWQVRGTPVTEVFEELSGGLASEASLVFRCEARGCGNASQWASRVYEERLLYGRAEYLRYAAFRYDDGRWVTLFSAARTADRQYFHVDVATPVAQATP